MNVILIGMRGCGKSSVSRRLSVLTKRPVISSDTLISYEAEGLSIPRLVSRKGWHHFRDLEFHIADKIADLDGLIVDCGGGIIVDLDPDGNEVYSERKVNALKENGLVIWLRGDIPRLAAKVRNDATRPTLSQTTADEELMRRREPFYARAADLVIDIEGKKKKRLTKEVLQRLVERGLVPTVDK